MAIAQTELKRVFKYQSLTLADPGGDKTPDQVRAMYAGQYGELATAVVEGPSIKGGVATYTFTRAVGSKGLTHIEALIQYRAGAMRLTQPGPLDNATLQQIEEAKQCSKIVGPLITRPPNSTPLLPVASAYSLFG